MRKITKEDFIGKTIIDMDCEAVNFLTFYFSDNTKISIGTEGYDFGMLGTLTGIAIQEEE